MSDLSVLIDGQEVFIEAAQSYGSEYTGVGDVIEGAQNAFDRAKTTISHVSQSMVSTVRNFNEATRPDEFSLEFGIKFKMDGSVVIASTSGEATLTVKMVYKHQRNNNSST